MKSVRHIDVRSHSCRKYIDALACGERVVFAKRTHGIWDHLTLLVTGRFEAEDYRRCDQMIFKGPAAGRPKTHQARADYLRYLGEILNDIVTARASSVSFALDYLTRRLRQPRIEMPVHTDPRLQRYWDADYCYSELFDRYELWQHTWTYAQMPVLGVVTQEILRLPQVAAQYHVVVFGPAKLRDLGARWGLSPGRFTFAPAPSWPDQRPRGSIFTDPVLPALRTYARRHEALEELSYAGDGSRRLFLFEAGTISQWLVARLAERFPHDSFLDLGRALELWFPDQPWPLKSPVDAHFRRAARRFYGDARYASLRAARQLETMT
ncbi:MAG: hypothetical protein Q8O33_08150 [Pseudomonadota bacterium]|nr:hypothetical protein [Pseudomonadota bacterium]